MQLNALPPRALALPDATLAALAEGYTREAGVRSLEREIGALCRDVAVRVARGSGGGGGSGVDAATAAAVPPPVSEDGTTADATDASAGGVLGGGGGDSPCELPVLMSPSDIEAVLGPARFERGTAERLSRPGVAMGLAWTPTGGEPARSDRRLGGATAGLHGLIRLRLKA